MGTIGRSLLTIDKVMESAIWQRAMASPQSLVEVPFQTLLAPEKLANDAVPTLLGGVIDLVFLEQPGWVIVDYKTDRAAVGAIPDLTERYAPQLRTYAEQWRTLTGEKSRKWAFSSRIKAVTSRCRRIDLSLLSALYPHRAVSYDRKSGYCGAAGKFPDIVTDLAGLRTARCVR
jgi:hypothetical protein